MSTNTIDADKVSEVLCESLKNHAEKATNAEEKELFESLQAKAEFLSVERNIIINALRNCYEGFKYADEYAGILQMHMSDEEFNSAMEDYKKDLVPKFGITYRDIDDQQIVTEAAVVLTAIDKELGTADIAELLNTDVLKTEEALQKYKVYKDGKVEETKS